jgi:SAM-dependent methyltransferase
MKDLFSGHSKSYAAFRPTYPKELYQFIYGHVHAFDIAWDCGTGNGQAARDLASVFTRVFATDISAAQLKNAVRAENIVYAEGEATDLPDQSVDLITVAQAIHWFDQDRFFREVKRVGKKEAVLAVWGYSLPGIASEIDILMNDFYSGVVGPFWDPERKLVDDHYRSISFPFREIGTPSFRFSAFWTCDDFQGYLNTWSAVQHYQQAKGENPVDRIIRPIQVLWGDGRRPVTFPLFLRLGRMT